MNFCNNKWFKANPIPASEQSNGLWQMIGDTINAQIRKICESSSALKDAEKGSNKQKIGDFFYTGSKQDLQRIEDQRLVINRQQTFVGNLGMRPKPRPAPAADENAFHRKIP